MISRLSINTPGQGLHLITPLIAAALKSPDARAALSADGSGLCTVFIRHTSASLTIQENASPDARRDLERWLNRLVREDDPDFTHTDEGPDDMPSHIKTVLTSTSLGIPIVDHQLALGTWQGIYLWEHRRAAHRRELIVHIGP